MIILRFNVSNSKRSVDIELGENHTLSSLVYASFCALEYKTKVNFELLLNNEKYSWKDNYLNTKLNRCKNCLTDISVDVKNDLIKLKYLGKHNFSNLTIFDIPRVIGNFEDINKIPFNSYFKMIFWDMKFGYENIIINTNKISHNV